MIDTSQPVESRFDRMDYLLDTTVRFNDPQALLEEIVNSMSDREFHDIYMYICRMWEIEPDQEKFNKLLEESNYDRALQGLSVNDKLRQYNAD